MMNKVNSVLHGSPDISRGSKVVTFIQTKARKMVLPNDTFLRDLNSGCGILGAEYKKVIPADNTSKYQ